MCSIARTLPVKPFRVRRVIALEVVSSFWRNCHSHSATGTRDIYIYIYALCIIRLTWAEHPRKMRKNIGIARLKRFESTEWKMQGELWCWIAWLHRSDVTMCPSYQGSILSVCWPWGLARSGTIIHTLYLSTNYQNTYQYTDQNTNCGGHELRWGCRWSMGNYFHLGFVHWPSVTHGHKW